MSPRLFCRVTNISISPTGSGKYLLTIAKGGGRFGQVGSRILHGESPEVDGKILLRFSCAYSLVPNKRGVLIIRGVGRFFKLKQAKGL